MKAAVLTGYDKNGRDLELRELPVPEPAAGEVLVRVHAAGVNPLDNMIVRGEVKLIVPYRFPLVMGDSLMVVLDQLCTWGEEHMGSESMGDLGPR